MADKRKLHHWLTIIKRVKTWQLLMLLIVLAGLSAYLLRQNNLEMVERRNLVKQADESGDNVVGALQELQRYVSTHMNTSLGEGIYLEHTYQRAYDDAVHKAASAITTNSQAYEDVEARCRQQYVRGGSFGAYIKCVEDGLKALAPGSDPLSQVKAPPQDLYRYNFVSPVWSLDAAGLTVLATLLVAVILALRAVGYVALRLMLKARIGH